jgi:exopolysaccharide production protein ExoZ
MGRIQILRAVAAVSVICFHETVRAVQLLNHTLLANAFGFGVAGVDLFFVISGFIIFTVHRNDIGRPEMLRPYLIKRFIRIYPIYWIVTLVIMPVYLSGYGLGSKRSPEVFLKSLVLFPQNPGTFPIVNVAWTLSYEVLFYLMFALLIGLRHRLVVVLVWTAWLIPCAVNLGLQLTHTWYPPANSLLFQFVFSDRNLEFLLGCGAAWVAPRLRPHFGRPAMWLGLAAFFALGFSIALSPSFHPFGDSTVALFALPSLLMVIGAACLDRTSARQAPRPLVELGDASYTLYLIHFSMVTAAFLLFRHLHVPATLLLPYAVVVLVACCTAARLVYAYIERPLLKRLRARLLPRTPVTP